MSGGAAACCAIAACGGMPAATVAAVAPAAAGAMPAAAATMPFTPGPYSGVSTLALVARASAFGVGVVYGTLKLSILKATKPHKKEEAHAHH